MAHVTSNQTERLVAINKLLPEIETFLREALATESLTEPTNQRREQLLSRLEGLAKPPQLPPRGGGGGKRISASYIGDEFINKPPTVTALADLHSTRDFISKQREISWRQKESDVPSSSQVVPAPYASKKRNQMSESEQPTTDKPSISSVSDETGIYEKIPSESGSGKYVDIIQYDPKTGPPPVPERTHRSHPLARKETIDNDDSSLPKNKQAKILIHDLQNPSHTGPLKELRNNAKIWCVLKKKKLYVFKDLTHPASQVIDMAEYDVHIENMTKSNFRLSRPGFPSLLLAAENDDEYRQWISALEKCKYEELDDIMPESFRTKDYNDEAFEEAKEDHMYERPLEIIAEVDKLNTNNEKLPKKSSSELVTNDITYEDMSGSQNIGTDDYVPSEIQASFVDGFGGLSYDAELPPIPLSSDEEYLGDHPIPNKEMLKNRHLPALPSEDQVSGSFDSLTSSSEEDTPSQSEKKPRSSSGPPGYNIKYQEQLSLDRRISGSLTRQQEKTKFFSDPDAVHCGILHQRRVLAVWQKRYCKVKNATLLCYRNPDGDEKPALEIYLSGYKIELCDKETWRSHSFKVSRENTEAIYFAAETREQLMRWLTVLVKESDKDKFAGKDTLPRGNKGLLTPQPSGDTTSISSMERKFDDEGSTCDADSESMESSVDDTLDNEQGTPKRRKRHSLKKRTNSERFQDSDAKLQGYLYRVLSNKWQRRWCVIKNQRFLAYKVSPYDLPEIEASLDTAKLVLPSTLTDLFLMKLVWEDLQLLLLAATSEEWKNWSTMLMKDTESKTEDKNLHSNLPKLPKHILKLNGKDKKESRSRNKKTAKNGTATFSQTNSMPVKQSVNAKDFNNEVYILESKDDTGKEGWCHVSNGKFTLTPNKSSTEIKLEISAKDVLLREEGVSQDGHPLFAVQKQDGYPVMLKMDTEEIYHDFLETLWLQGASIYGDENSVAHKAIQVFKNKFNQKDNLTRKQSLIPDINEPSKRAMSDGEPNILRPRKLTRSDKAGMTKSSWTKSGGSRMSNFFRSLPKRNRKKHDYSADTTDGLPKTQFSGNIKEVHLNENGEEIFTTRLGKVSGKIFYAYDIENEVKPIFKVPLRNAAIEDVMEKENDKFMFSLSSMEDRGSFQFKVESEESFEKWTNALYLLDDKSNTIGLSSRESLLDETRSDVEMRPEVSSSASVSAMLSKQAKNLAGSGDEAKTERKISEEVFHGNLEAIRHSGYLFELNITEKNDIKSRTKTRRWCVLRKSWVEVYKNENDKIPVRGIALNHHKLDVAPIEEVGEKFAICLHSDEENFILCANHEEDFNKWMMEFKKVLKKQGRRTSDTAKLALRTAGGGLRNLLSSSSLTGIGKRDSKRGTIVLNEVDEKVVEKFTDDVESGNKISGVLTIVMQDGKLTKPKKRVCTIKDGKFCIAKRSKPGKVIYSIELSNVAILDECEMEKGLFRFRLDYGEGQSMTFQTVDHKSADNWMVGISMAILLERLTSPEKFSHQDVDQTSENQTEVDGLGMAQLTPTLTRDPRGSTSSNLSIDIKKEIDRKISFGSSYLNPLSNLLESAFDPASPRYSASSTSSSREGTLERDFGTARFSRAGSRKAIKEEMKEDIEEVSASDNDVIDETLKHTGTEKSGGSQASLQSTGSVSSTVAKFERMNSPVDDNVFKGPHNAADESEIEVQLADLLKEREALEKERNVILDRLPDMKNIIKDAKERKESESSSSEIPFLAKEYETTTSDLNQMKKRLEVVSKRLSIIGKLLGKKVPKITESFRTRATVISPHIIV